MSSKNHNVQIYCNQQCRLVVFGRVAAGKSRKPCKINIKISLKYQTQVFKNCLKNPAQVTKSRPSESGHEKTRPSKSRPCENHFENYGSDSRNRGTCTPCPSCEPGYTKVNCDSERYNQDSENTTKGNGCMPCAIRLRGY